MTAFQRTDEFPVFSSAMLQTISERSFAETDERVLPNGIASMQFVANANSVHVKRWLQILSGMGCSVLIETANPVPPSSDGLVEVRPLLSRWLRVPMTVRYLLAGLAMRFRKRSRPRRLIHAHSASGNGVIAWLSGQPYVVGTYGSEILEVGERGVCYRWLLRQVLRGAERISACSMETIEVLCEQLGVPRERVYYFHLGYDEETFQAVKDEDRRRLRRAEALPADEPIWVVNRRARPLYRTREVVDGFLRYRELGGRGRLVLLCGDHLPDYTQQIRDRIREHAEGEGICVVDRMLSQREVARWLQLADFSISVPRSDNFSISTLEAMGCGAVPVLSDLVAYDQLRPCTGVRWMNQFGPADFAAMFAETSATWPVRHANDRHECQQFAAGRFSTEGAGRAVMAFYQGTSLPAVDALRRELS